MNGPLAQIVALTCHGNAVLGGHGTSLFFPGNSTCQFCDSIKFIESKKTLLGKPVEVVQASNPNEWISGLRKHDVIGIRLGRTPQNNPMISDRMSAGLVGGGGNWKMEVLLRNGRSEFWAARWEVWDRNAPEHKIWRVTYTLVGSDETKQYHGRELSVVKRDFEVSLRSILQFSIREDCSDFFRKCFSDALKALSDPNADVGYHKDLAAPDQLTDEAVSLLKASMSAWVFGAMGSWNDNAGFKGAAQKEYEEVSNNLFNILNEAIEVVASGSVEFRIQRA